MAKKFAHIVPNASPNADSVLHPLPDDFDTSGKFVEVAERAEPYIPEGYHAVGFRTQLEPNDKISDHI